MKYRTERPGLPLGGIVFVFCALVCCCTAVPTWQPTYPPGCDYEGKVYRPGETIYEKPGCEGYGAYCSESGIVHWDNFGYGCCEHQGQHYEDGQTVTIGGVTCYCEGSQGEHPAPMICPETSTQPVTTTTSQPDTIKEEEDDMQVWYDQFMGLMDKMLSAVKTLGKCSTLPTF